MRRADSLEKTLMLGKFSLVQLLSRVQLFATLWNTAHQASLTIIKYGACSDSCPLSRWCYPIISSSVAHFSSCSQSFPASGSFLVSRLLTSSDQSIGALASVSVFPMNIQDWFPLGLTGLIFLLSKGLSRVFSSTTTWKHQFFSALQPSLWSNSHIRTGTTIAFIIWTFVGQVMYGLEVFPTFFNLGLNFAIRSSWSEPQSAPGVFADCIEHLHL